MGWEVLDGLHPLQVHEGLSEREDRKEEETARANEEHGALFEAVLLQEGATTAMSMSWRKARSEPTITGKTGRTAC